MTVVALLMTTVTACAPQVAFAPVAVRLSASGAPEILYTSCTPEPIVRVEVVAPAGAVFDDEDVRLWKVVLHSPETRRSFTVGVAPPGAVEQVRWQQPDKDKALVARLIILPDAATYEDFTIGDLQDGKVRFHDRLMTASEFAKESSCKN